MMNWLFAIMLAAGFVTCFIGGGADAALDCLTAGASEAVTLSLTLAGAYMLWMGLMRIATDAGLVDSLSRAAQRPLGKLFPNAGSAVAPITLNLTTNFFGMGSAATPFGLAAMKELSAAGGGGAVATDAMCMFLALNSSAIELLPTGVLALRAAAGSADAYSVIVPTFVASIFAFASAIASCKLLCRLFPYKPQPARE